MRTKNKRFSVSLSKVDYEKLQRIAKQHRPELTLQYLVNWSIQRLLDRAEDPQLYLDLGNPVKEESV
jgi:hypothetical protein